MSDLFPERIETDRLVLEAFTRENVDVLTLFRHSSRHNPHIDEITKHIGWDPHVTPKESLDFLQSQEQARTEGEDAAYVVRPKGGEARSASEQSSGEPSDPRDGEDGAGEFAGMAGLHPDWDRRTATLGTWLRKPFWGRGYSGERAAALMAVAFERLDLEAVTVTHEAGNAPSRRAIEKYVEAHGGRHDGLLRNGGVGSDGPVDLHRYSISREEWERNRSDEDRDVTIVG